MISVNSNRSIRHFVVIILIVLGTALNAQTKYNQDLISKSTDKLVKKIAKKNELMGSSVYYGGTRPQQYDNFEKLKKTASQNELLELTNHPNGVVRCYAFWALTYDKSINLFPILLKHIYDYEVVHTQFGCLGSKEMVGDFLIRIATPRVIDLESKKLDSIQFLKLDSVLIFSNSKLYAKSRAINRAETSEFLYPRLRKLVVENNDQSALVALAKYNKPEDIALILKIGKKSKSNEVGYFNIYRAIQEFPHPDFIPLLENNLNKTLDNTHYSSEWKELYKAIATYKNKRSIELLKIPFTQVKHKNIRKYHIDFVYEAIQLNKCEMYDTLLWEMWEEEKRISPDVYRYLKARNSSKAYELTIKSLLRSDKVFSAGISLNLNNLGSTENLTSMMLDEILEKDKKMGIEIICENIKNANVHQFPIFTKKVVKLKDSLFIEPLFKRLEKEWNAHVYLNIAQVLIAYQDEEINKRILDTRKRNENLNKDWGSESLDEILKENSLIE